MLQTSKLRRRQSQHDVPPASLCICDRYLLFHGQWQRGVHNLNGRVRVPSAIAQQRRSKHRNVQRIAVWVRGVDKHVAAQLAGVRGQADKSSQSGGNTKVCKKAARLTLLALTHTQQKAGDRPTCTCREQGYLPWDWSSIVTGLIDNSALQHGCGIYCGETNKTRTLGTLLSEIIEWSQSVPANTSSHSSVKGQRTNTHMSPTGCCRSPARAQRKAQSG